MTDHALLDRPDILSVVFHPREDHRSDDAKDIRIPVAEGVSLAGRLHAAGKDAPLLLFFHGNGEIASDYDDIAPVYNRLGLSFLIVDYRGYGKSDGTPMIATMLSDACTVYDHLPALCEAHGLAPARVYVMGRSLGSASAIEIGNHAANGIAGMIIESGFAYPLQLIQRLGCPVPGAGEDDGSGLIGAIPRIATITVPTLIIHGEEDWIIPVTDARALHEHSGAQAKRLLTIPGAGHNDLMWRGQQAYFEAIHTFISGQ